MSKIKCADYKCGWRGDSSELLVAKHPFDNSPDAKVYGCPDCLSIDDYHPACDEEGCWKTASCGTPTENGYRQTCGDHRPDK